MLIVASYPAAPSKHSRAARRETSPSIDTDRSLKTARPPAESADVRPTILAAHRGGGVSKEKRKAGGGRKAVLSTRARRRLERSAHRAETVADRSANKVHASKAQLGVIRSRKRPWEEINRDVAGTRDASAKAKIASVTVFGILGAEEKDDGDVEGGKGDGEEATEDNDEALKEVVGQGHAPELETEMGIAAEDAAAMGPQPEEEDDIQ